MDLIQEIEKAMHRPYPGDARATLAVVEKWLRGQDKRMVRAWTLANELAAMRKEAAALSAPAGEKPARKEEGKSAENEKGGARCALEP